MKPLEVSRVLKEVWFERLAGDEEGIEAVWFAACAAWEEILVYLGEMFSSDPKLSVPPGNVPAQ